MAEEDANKMTRNQRYHLLNRETRLQKKREQYNNDPQVIAKREERERLKAEKEAEKIAMKDAEKEAKRQQKQLELQEKIKIAAETKRVRGGKSGAADSVRQASEISE
jgi:hypothetical protein